MSDNAPDLPFIKDNTYYVAQIILDGIGKW